jgi:hypothetical protein
MIRRIEFLLEVLRGLLGYAEDDLRHPACQKSTANKYDHLYLKSCLPVNDIICLQNTIFLSHHHIRYNNMSTLKL